MNHKWNMDRMRFLAAILVIAVHTYPFAGINEEFDYLFTHVFCRIAVPLFLMITGYYVLKKGLTDKKYMVNYTKKISIVYGLCILLYLPINFYTGQFQTYQIFDYFKWIFFNGTFYHLWYFPALLLGLWIVYFLIKYTKEYMHFIILFFLFLLGLLGDSYYGFTTHIPFLKVCYDAIFSFFDYTRNGLFYTPIFLYIGYYFSKIEWKLSRNKNVGFLIYFLIVLELEGFLLHQFALQKHDSMYVMLIPVMIFLFPLLLRLKGNGNKKIRNLATLIYVIHPLIIIAVRGLAKVMRLENYLVYQNHVHFIVVAILSILVSYFLLWTYDKWKNYNLLNRNEKSK